MVKTINKIKNSLNSSQNKGRALKTLFLIVFSLFLVGCVTPKKIVHPPETAFPPKYHNGDVVLPTTGAAESSFGIVIGIAENNDIHVQENGDSQSRIR